MSKRQNFSVKKGLEGKGKRIFSEAFKRSKVKDLAEKRIGVTEFSKLYGVSRAAVYKWIYKYSDLEKGTNKVIQMESEEYRTKQLLERVAELERTVGQKQLEIDYLQKTLELSSQEVGYDLKKKYAPKSSNTSDWDIDNSASE